jgi:hypothetical protein
MKKKQIKQPKKLSFLEKALQNVNETTLQIQNFAIKHQEKKMGLAEKPQKKWKNWLKIVICYGSAIGIGVLFGFFYGLISLTLIMFFWSLLEDRF